MIKIRLHGTKKDIETVIDIFKSLNMAIPNNFNILCLNDSYKDRGTSVYERAYLDVEINKLDDNSNLLKLTNKEVKKQKEVGKLRFIDNKGNDYGIIGEESNLVDSLGNKLFVGDMVRIDSNGNKYFNGKGVTHILLEDSICEVMPVVKNGGEYFVMGVYDTTCSGKIEGFESRRIDSYKNRSLGEIINLSPKRGLYFEVKEAN